MKLVIEVTVTTVDKAEYANLGRGDLALAIAKQLEATKGGFHIEHEGDILYYNGACDGSVDTQGDYQDLINRALR